MNMDIDLTDTRDAEQSMHDPSTTNGLFATTATAAGGGISWVLQQLWAHGPTWSLVPPLLFSAASVVGAVIAGLKARQESIHKEEWHKLKLEAERRRLEREANPPPEWGHE